MTTMKRAHLFGGPKRMRRAKERIERVQLLTASARERAIELARDVGLAQARNVERMANSALMLNPEYLAGLERYVQGIGGKGKDKS